MNDVKFMQEVIRDILLTEEYSVSGIAFHTNVPEEVVIDIAAGINTNPTYSLSKKLLELHMMVKRDLYNDIVKRAVTQLQ